MNTKFSLFGLIAVLMAGGCSDDFRKTAEWKDITIMYGMFNPSDATHYLRVEKAYLDESTSALTIAQISDSLYYDPAKISVKLYSVDFRNGGGGSVTSCNAADTAYTEIGEFSRVDANLEPNMVVAPSVTFVTAPKWVYKINATLTKGKFYKVAVRKNEFGTETSAIFQANSDIAFSQQTIPNNPNTLTMVSSSGGYTTRVFRWENKESEPTCDNPINANDPYRLVMNDLTMNFYYNENGVEKKLDYSLARSVSSAEKNSQLNEIDPVDFKEFYRYLGAQLPEAVDGTRCFKKITFTLDIADYSLFKFYQTLSANSGLSATFNPSNFYSNVNNGLGLVTARHRIVKPDTYFLTTDSKSLDSLQNSSFTRHLGFTNQICQ